jgi:hypothetical protein
MALVGSTLYPPLMGFLSITVGLTVAMLGTVALGSLPDAPCWLSAGSRGGASELGRQRAGTGLGVSAGARGHMLGSRQTSIRHQPPSDP